MVGVWRVSKNMGTASATPKNLANLIPATRNIEPIAQTTRVFRAVLVMKGTNLTIGTGVFAMSIDAANLGNAVQMPCDVYVVVMIVTIGK